MDSPHPKELPFLLHTSVLNRPFINVFYADFEVAEGSRQDDLEAHQEEEHLQGTCLSSLVHSFQLILTSKSLMNRELNLVVQIKLVVDFTT